MALIIDLPARRLLAGLLSHPSTAAIALEPPKNPRLGTLGRVPAACVPMSDSGLVASVSSSP